MKTAVIIVAIFGIVFADPVQLTYENCERLDVDATLTVTAFEGATEQETVKLTTSPTESVLASGSCDGTTRSLVVYFNKTETKIIFTFSLTAQQMVSLVAMVQSNAKTLFPDKNFTGGITVSQTGALALSNTNTSFKCVSEQTVDFPKVNGTGADYEMTLTLKGLQVQAFNLPNDGSFSDAVECEQDEASTTEPTTPAASTTDDNTTPEPSTEPTTSEKPDTTTPEVTTSATTMAPTPVNTYNVSEGNETCVKMVAAIELMVQYMNTDNQTVTATFPIPSTATAEGTCGEENATLTVMFDSDSVEFMFEDQNKKAMIDMVNLTVTLDANRFPGAKDAGKKVTFTSSGQIAQTDDSEFYRCIAGTEVKFDTATMDITNLRVQAFNLKDGEFTGQGTDCPADMTTSTSTPTPSTSPQPAPSGPSVNNYTVNDQNGTCLMMKASLVLDITYPTTDNKFETVEIAVPSDADYTGNCGQTVETLTIRPFRDNAWKIEMIFSAPAQLDSSNVGADDDEYQLSNLTITYTYDNHLPKNNDTGKNVTVTSAVNKFDAPVKGSYKCNANVTIELNGDVSLKTSNFRYQAFQTNSTDFNNDDLQECNADIETNSIVPIAVGAALAGLVVIVLIAYLIGRRKSRRQGYESV